MVGRYSSRQSEKQTEITTGSVNKVEIVIRKQSKDILLQARLHSPPQTVAPTEVHVPILEPLGAFLIQTTTSVFCEIQFFSDAFISIPTLLRLSLHGIPFSFCFIVLYLVLIQLLHFVVSNFAAGFFHFLPFTFYKSTSFILKHAFLFEEFFCLSILDQYLFMYKDISCVIVCGFLL